MDLVIKNVKIVDFEKGIVKSDIGIKGKQIVKISKGLKGKKKIYGKGLYAIPSFIDGHIHIESTMLTVAEFVKTIAASGTGAVVADPHEIANVLGVRGVRLMIREARNLPVEIFFTVPSCVPSTDMETSGAVLDSKKVKKLLNNPRIVGLGEVMNFWGAITGDSEVVRKIRYAKEKGKRVDGHCPGLSGNLLSKYIEAGIESDHESVSGKEALEKLKKGMFLMIREGSAARNLGSVLPYLLKRKVSFDRCMLVSDDKHPEDIDRRYMDYMVRKAVALGVEPVDAIKMASLNPAKYFGLKNHGSISVGKYANIVLVNNLRQFRIRRVILKGKEAGKWEFRGIKYPRWAVNSVKLKIKRKELKKKLNVKPYGKKVRIIGIVPNQIITKCLEEKVEDVWKEKDTLKIAVVERHGKTKNVSVGFIKGFGMKKGALATTVAHDSHNIIVVGRNDGDMVKAIYRLEEIGGGLILVDKKIRSELPLKLAGLMSMEKKEVVEKKLNRLHKAARKLGCTLDSPFTTLSFMALPVIPELKITDKGLVKDSKFVKLFF